MATRTEWTKTGLRLVAETSKRPLPRLRTAFPVPQFGSGASSLLSLALEVVPATGRQGIRVRSLQDLQGSWVLHHAAHTGARPADLAWETLLSGDFDGPLNHLLDAPLAGATHLFRLQHRQPGAPREVYPEASLATPDDIPPAAKAITPRAPLTCTLTLSGVRP